ncbi:hypothetical protein CBR_g45900 [Chara braunii]|uniref:Helicase Sen1 N-terminal domain-containing protein n=1 Tax=Chara braunii TaxID=69332 RepID=A0A388LZL8_CHABU|nr:hypothetical protein CBR_g45900 [Chara braunii]|eukprot:GBG87746.1 hypothetical protein CBR_g45900 [Chara braunii]
MSMTVCARAAMDGVERDAERLLKQWNAILTEKDEKECQELRNKWFFESLPFLVALPDGIHCWCGHYEIAWPSIEPLFYMNKRRDGETVSVVEELWARMSKELAHCVHCVKRRHEGLQEYFNIVQDGESAARLSRIMDRLEMERVAGVVKDLWTQIDQRQFMVQEFGFDNLVTVIYEVLSYPWLLDDAEIFYEFGKVLHYIHEEFSLELADGSEYGGLFWLLFHNDSNVRLDATHLIEKHEELKTAKDMEKIQPLLMKCMTMLERNQFSEEEVAISLSLKGRVSSAEGHTGPEEAGTSGSHAQAEEDSIRPKTTFKRVQVWNGIYKILDLAETRALEVGIVEQYVSFLSIVVDHVSEATAVLWNALRCLKILLEKLVSLMFDIDEETPDPRTRQQVEEWKRVLIARLDKLMSELHGAGAEIEAHVRSQFDLRALHDAIESAETGIDVIQVPGLNLQDNQVLYIYSRALPEPIRGQLVAEIKSGKYNYRQFRYLALRREQMISQVKNSYASVVKIGGDAGAGAGKRILWRQKRQDHTLAVFDDDTVEEWPLEAEGVASSSDFEKGEVTAAVVNKGGPRPPMKKKKPRSFLEHLGIAIPHRQELAPAKSANAGGQEGGLLTGNLRRPLFRKEQAISMKEAKDANPVH